jgi:DNA-directed RNA polymerase specialized sigma24 family protein
LSGQAEEDTIPRLNSLSAYDYIQALYRLCLVQSGSAALAEKAVRDILSNAFRKANRELEKVDFHALFRSAFEQDRSYGKSPRTELTGWPQRLHLLPEPQRSTLALFYLEILPPALIADIANLSLEQLAETVRDGRSAIQAARK